MHFIGGPHVPLCHSYLLICGSVGRLRDRLRHKCGSNGRVNTAKNGGALVALAAAALAQLTACAGASPAEDVATIPASLEAAQPDALLVDDVAPATGSLPVSDIAQPYDGIVALSGCSGALVRFIMSKPGDAAMVMTNGHCYEGGFIAPGVALREQASSRGFDVLRPSDGQTIGKLSASRILYATMTGTDVTLYQLSSTFADISSRYSVNALTISDRHPVVGAPIRIISGFWRRSFSCTIRYFVNELDEGQWVWRDSIRFTDPGCETFPGTSGAPIVHRTTGEIIGINNTGNERGERCSNSNPCEVDAAGNVTYEKGASYGQETYILYACLNEAGKFDFSKPDCTLQKPNR